MSARAKGKWGARITMRVLDARRKQVELSYQDLATRSGFKSVQHLHNIFRGKSRLQFSMLKPLADALALDYESVLLLWNVGRLIDERIDPQDLSVLCPRRNPVGPGVDGIPGNDPPTRHGGDEHLPSRRGGNGTPGAAAQIDTDLIIQLLGQAGAISGAANAGSLEEALTAKFLWVVGRVALVSAYVVVFGSVVQHARVIADAAVLIMSRMFNRRNRSQIVTPQKHAIRFVCCASG